MQEHSPQQDMLTLEAEFQASYRPVASLHMAFSAIAWPSDDGRFYAVRVYLDDSMWVLVMRGGEPVFPSAAAARAFASQSSYLGEVFLARVPGDQVA